MKKIIYPLVVLGVLPLTLSAAGYQQGYQQGGRYQQPQGGQTLPEMPDSMKPVGSSSQSQSDRKILQEIRDQFKKNGLPNAIKVTVESGKVTLDGPVDTEEFKVNAEQISYDVDGVNHVINRLMIMKSDDPRMKMQQKQDNTMKQNLNYNAKWDQKNLADKTEMQTQNAKGTDQDLEKKIKDKLNSSGMTKKYNQLQFSVEKGTVTLSGKVNTAQERAEVEKAIGNLPGVKMIRNNIQAGGQDKSSPGSRY